MGPWSIYNKCLWVLLTNVYWFRATGGYICGCGRPRNLVHIYIFESCRLSVVFTIVSLHAIIYIMLCLFRPCQRLRSHLHLPKSPLAWCLRVVTPLAVSLVSCLETKMICLKTYSQHSSPSLTKAPIRQYRNIGYYHHYHYHHHSELSDLLFMICLNLLY